MWGTPSEHAVLEMKKKSCAYFILGGVNKQLVMAFVFKD